MTNIKQNFREQYSGSSIFLQTKNISIRSRYASYSPASIPLITCSLLSDWIQQIQSDSQRFAESVVIPGLEYRLLND